MNPTNKLRFVQRVEPITEDTGRYIRVLQQWWEDPNVVLAVLQFGPNGMPIRQHPGEWRDVPMETEEDA